MYNRSCGESWMVRLRGFISTPLGSVYNVVGDLKKKKERKMSFIGFM